MQLTQSFDDERYIIPIPYCTGFSWRLYILNEDFTMALTREIAIVYFIGPGRDRLERGKFVNRWVGLVSEND